MRLRSACAWNPAVSTTQWSMRTRPATSCMTSKVALGDWDFSQSPRCFVYPDHFKEKGGRQSWLKQKEIKFRRDGKLFYGQQNGVKYSIHEDASPARKTSRNNTMFPSTIPTSGTRSFTTNGYRTFDLDGARPSASRSAAGEFDPAPIHAAQARDKG